MKKGLFALALGTFTLGIAEFIIEGILTDVAHNMNVSIPQAGHLISIYALGVCAGAFSLILMHKYRPKNILLFLTSLVILGAIIATIASSYGLLLCARFIQGLPHGAYEDGEGGKGYQGGGDDVCRYAVCQSAGCSARHLPESYHLLASAFSHVGGVGRHHALYDLQVGS